MSKICLELFDKNCEITSFEYKNDNSLLFEFTEKLEGYIKLGSQASRFSGKCCRVNLEGLAEGEYVTHLILENETVNLPKIKNECGVIIPTEHTVAEIGDLSLRERRLCKRVSELEKKLEEISKKVYGSTIF